jgi:hypothetical protein
MDCGGGRRVAGGKESMSLVAAETVVDSLVVIAPAWRGRRWDVEVGEGGA